QCWRCKCLPVPAACRILRQVVPQTPKRGKPATLVVGGFTDINHQDERGNTLLMFAAIKRQDRSLPETKELVDLGAALDLQNCYGNTALILAALVNNLDTVHYLVDSGADVQPRNEEGLNVLDVLNNRIKDYEEIEEMLGAMV
ncbi:MAG: ankyrin repeat domain-containing protein, partial [Actinomycetaceae bacterium]|nr:ankyrin repeat domain-containing protein [Actinomycetaceae bacterium]